MAVWVVKGGQLQPFQSNMSPSRSTTYMQASRFLGHPSSSVGSMTDMVSSSSSSQVRHDSILAAFIRN
jgi:hypothetical protein